jgi:hypothetical protein
MAASLQELVDWGRTDSLSECCPFSLINQSTNHQLLLRSSSLGNEGDFAAIKTRLF